MTTFAVYWLVGWLWRAGERKTTASRTFAAFSKFSISVIHCSASRGVLVPVNIVGFILIKSVTFPVLGSFGVVIFSMAAIVVSWAAAEVF